MEWPHRMAARKRTTDMPLPDTKELTVAQSEEPCRVQHLTSLEEWRALASAWPLKRLVAIWNDLPGVVPVQKFTSREIALENLAVSSRFRAREDAERERAESDSVSRRLRTQPRSMLCSAGRKERRRELQKRTGWQRHSVRGFLSVSLRKQGQKVRSFERAGERVYRLKS